MPASHIPMANQYKANQYQQDVNALISFYTYITSKTESVFTCRIKGNCSQTHKLPDHSLQLLQHWLVLAGYMELHAFFDTQNNTQNKH